jgi:hypothetical protein
MKADGTCPSCGRTVDTPEPITAKNIDLRRLAAGDDAEPAKAPWHFKVLVVALAVYLGYRVVYLFL